MQKEKKQIIQSRGECVIASPADDYAVGQIIAHVFANKDKDITILSVGAPYFKTIKLWNDRVKHMFFNNGDEARAYAKDNGLDVIPIDIYINRESGFMREAFLALTKREIGGMV